MEKKPEFESIAIIGAIELGLDLEGFVGKGAFKETYRVSDANQKQLAFKIFDSQKCNRERSDREIEAMSLCDCPHIGKLYSFGTFSEPAIAGIAFSLEEYFDGGTLTSKCKSGPLKLKELKVLGLTLSLALHHLRQLRLVHRDLKPDNIMYRLSDGKPVLVDFGLVRNLSAESLTLSWLLQGPGTPMYSAPEQLNNEKALISWRTDQFSLAVVLAVCAFGVHPHQRPGMSIAEAIRSAAMREQPSVECASRAEQAGLACLLKMLQPWPIHRFQTPEELIAAMENIGG